MGPDYQSEHWNAYSLPKNYLQAGIYYDSHYRKYDPLYKIGSGGGIYISHGSPTIKKCYIRRNYVEFDGAGIYSRSGPKLMQNCLFENNFTLQGQGCGMYNLFQKDGTIDGCVFDGNEVGKKDSIFSGTINSERSNLNIVNSIFTRNLGGVSGAAIFNRQGNLTITNCTFTANQSTEGAGGITNYYEATANIVNSIFWNNQGESELQGDSFTVRYSCVEGGYPGEGNISSNPELIDDGDPKGGNGKYGDFDDGLRLSSISPCKEAGTSLNAPDYDILLINRPYEDSVDMGAYEYEDYTNQSEPFGYLIDGTFVPVVKLDIMEKFYHWKYIRMYSKSNFARVMRIAIPKNKYTKDETKIYIYLRGPDLGDVKIDLIKVDEDKNSLYFQSKTDTWGKVILFVNDEGYHNWNNPWAYIIYAEPSGSETSIHYRLPFSQFK